MLAAVQACVRDTLENDLDVHNAIGFGREGRAIRVDELTFSSQSPFSVETPMSRAP